MRKVSSAPSLVNLTAAQGQTAGCQFTLPALHSSTAHPLHRSKRDRKATELSRLGSNSLDGGQSRQKRTLPRVAAHHAPPPPPSLLDEADQLVVEAFQPQGIFGSGQCLELFGKVASAPDLRAGVDESQEDQDGDGARREALVGGRPELGGDERLAECLATPFTGDDKNLGEIVRDEARQAMKQAQLRTQLRYAEETRVQQASENESQRRTELSSPSKGETPQQPRQRRRRRMSEDLYAYLHSLGINVEPVSAPTGSADADHSPETKAALSSIFSSLDDASNTLHMDDHQPVSEEDFMRYLNSAPATRHGSSNPPTSPAARSLAFSPNSPSRTSLRA